MGNYELAEKVYENSANLEVLLRLLMRKGVITEKEFAKEGKAYEKELEEEHRSKEPSKKVKEAIEKEIKRDPTGWAHAMMIQHLRSAYEGEDWDNYLIDNVKKKYGLK